MSPKHGDTRIEASHNDPQTTRYVALLKVTLHPNVCYYYGSTHGPHSSSSSTALDAVLDDTDYECDNDNSPMEALPMYVFIYSHFPTFERVLSLMDIPISPFSDFWLTTESDDGLSKPAEGPVCPRQRQISKGVHLLVGSIPTDRHQF